MINAEDIKIKKITDKLLNYEGINPYLNYLKKKVKFEKYQLTKTQIDYINKNHNKDVIDLDNVVSITNFFGQELQKQYGLKKAPEKILIKTVVGEIDKAYHVLGKFYKNQEDVKLFWLPKTQLVDDLFVKYDNVTVDFEKYEKIDKLGRKYFEHQKEGVKFMLDKKKCINAADMGLGKALSINELVFTPNGKKEIGNLVIGDKVIGSDGKSHNVTGIFPQGILDTYKITFNDGYSIVCSEDHLWKVYSANNGKNTKGRNHHNKSMILSTKQMYEGGKFNNVETHYKCPNGNNKWQIPIVEPIQFENNDELPIDPYLLGLCLGDGHIRENKGGLNKRKCTINFGDKIIKLNLQQTRSHTKFIPDIYKYSSVENRLAILQGLMDTYGHYMVKKNNIFNGTEFSTVSEKLCDDVAEIVQTLGGICRKKSIRSFYKKNGVRVECKISYSLNIKLPTNMNPFRLKRKSEKYVTPKKYSVGRYIKNIEKHEPKECVCISVDAPDKLYVTEHCIVTHNTTQSILAALEVNSDKTLIICPSSLKINWGREIAVFTDEEDISIIKSGEWNPKKFTIINYDILKNFHTITERGKTPKYINRDIVNTKFNTIIIDESHFIKNSKSNRGKIILQIIKECNPEYIWLLTGTPIANRPIDYFNLLNIIKAPVASDWSYYVRRYCGGKQIKTKVKGKLRTINLSNGASNLEELGERTKTTIIRRTKEQVLDLPDKTIIPVYLELEDKKGYDDVFEKYLDWRRLQGKSTNIARHLVELILLRKFIAMEKVKDSIELAESSIESGKKVLIFTNFKDELERFKQHFGETAVYLDGSTKETDRQKAVDEFQNNEDVKVFVGQIKAAGVGITLTKAEVVIINSLDWVPGNLEQAEDRCIFGGQSVMTNNGYKLIEDIKIGDMVYTHLGNFKKVIDCYNHLENKKLRVDIKAFGYDKPLSITHDHKIYVYDSDFKSFYWIEAVKLNVRKHYLTLHSNATHMDNIQIINDYMIFPINEVEISNLKNAEERVYDLSVEDDHSFVVGTYNVHNCYRIGQTKDVVVYYPLIENTVDTLVWKVLQNKKTIINTIIGDVDDGVIETIIKEL